MRKVSDRDMDVKKTIYKPDVPRESVSDFIPLSGMEKSDRDTSFRTDKDDAGYLGALSWENHETLTPEVRVSSRNHEDPIRDVGTPL